jgi:hypothetical protein
MLQLAKVPRWTLLCLAAVLSAIPSATGVVGGSPVVGMWSFPGPLVESPFPLTARQMIYAKLWMVLSEYWVNCLCSKVRKVRAQFYTSSYLDALAPSPISLLLAPSIPDSLPFPHQPPSSSPHQHSLSFISPPPQHSFETTTASPTTWGRSLQWPQRPRLPVSIFR